MRIKCEELGFQTIYDIPISHQCSVREDLIDEHLAFLRGIRGDYTLTFSVFMWLADWMRWGWSAVSAEDWERIVAKCRQCAQLYDQIELVPNGAALEYDGYAWLDVRNAAQIYSLCSYALTLLGQESKIVRGGACGE